VHNHSNHADARKRYPVAHGWFGSVGGKKKGVPLDTPPEISAVSRLKRLFQGVDAGAEVYVKGCSIHHEGRD
jgi:hypothetical protein